MEAVIRTESERAIKIDDVVEGAVTVNRGLIVGFGTEGCTLAITPPDIPHIIYRFTWGEVIDALLRVQR